MSHCVKESQNSFLRTGICMHAIKFLFGSDVLRSIPEQTKPHMLNANVFLQFKLLNRINVRFNGCGEQMRL